MPLGDAELRSERLRSPADLLLDDAAACHAYAWLYKHQPATVGEYVRGVGVNERQARLAVNRLESHGMVFVEDDGEGDPAYLADPFHGTVGDAAVTHVTVGVAAVLATQLENYDARAFVQRHGTRALADAVRYWPLVRDGAMDSRAVGPELGLDPQAGVTAMNFVRGVADYVDIDPRFDEVPTPDAPPSRSV